MASVAKVKSLDHLVLTVKDIDATIKFYQDVCGMQHTSFPAATDPSITRHALNFGNQKINLHQTGKEFEPKAERVQPGSGDLCFLVEDDVVGVLDRLKEKGISVLEGGNVVERTGAQGKLRSVYLRDPDGNLIE
ncbi:biphenyl-2,3-diol 1,2-dioxygenase [Cladophialophora psammophila CBS 110553]|uniref:Biphenyl-2,3-diol 1,2-dioxygenase n=1 Tax=Cladophialophora psammophila CBS 110553 TaxID=1182543 RepID=W9XJH4_9EURO|nr:biphenyl-2,3-diol 1,2-dioxygenase [Cladophialophora psammophila CBS 110553]EXJ70514.1 biphenyl-2,3-diol 1,2-dioxygenase [Cladophialophora psammophila CBS 110553]